MFAHSFARTARWLTALVLGLLSWTAMTQSDFQGATHLVPSEEDTISYNKTPSTGPIARLQSSLDRGEVKLKFDPATGWRDSLLAALGISPKSQTLVFSKTSLQRERIAPQHPRALYFNDEVYVGWIPGAPVMEFSEVDAKLGGVEHGQLRQQQGGEHKEDELHAGVEM